MHFKKTAKRMIISWSDEISRKHKTNIEPLAQPSSHHATQTSSHQAKIIEKPHNPLLRSSRLPPDAGQASLAGEVTENQSRDRYQPTYLYQYLISTRYWCVTSQNVSIWTWNFAGVHLAAQGPNDLVKQPPSHPAIEPPFTEMASAGSRSGRISILNSLLY